MSNMVDLYKMKRDKRSNDMPMNYLFAEQLINEIKDEYAKILKGESKDHTLFNELNNKFEKLENDLTECLYTELIERLNMSLSAIECVFGYDKEKVYEARVDFQVGLEIINHIQMNSFKFKDDYYKTVREELSEE